MMIVMLEMLVIDEMPKKSFLPVIQCQYVLPLEYRQYQYVLRLNVPPVTGYQYVLPHEYSQYQYVPKYQYVLPPEYRQYQYAMKVMKYDEVVVTVSESMLGCDRILQGTMNE
jgi:hypothetical protein